MEFQYRYERQAAKAFFILIMSYTTASSEKVNYSFWDKLGLFQMNLFAQPYNPPLSKFHTYKSYIQLHPLKVGKYILYLHFLYYQQIMTE